MLVSFFSGVRARDIRWKTAAIFGAIAAVLTLLAELNNLPLTAFDYDTTDTYGSFLTGQLLNSLFAAAVQGIFIFFLTAAAEPLYRRYYANQIQIGGQFTPAGLRTKRFLLGTILGLAMTPAFLAYQVLFYIAAEQLVGAWGPADIPYSQMVNTYIPWIMVLLIGFMPAVFRGVHLPGVFDSFPAQIPQVPLGCGRHRGPYMGICSCQLPAAALLHSRH